ncbi:MAG TPA: PTS glucose transporter subunit IIA [Neobacillus sp.]|jgi:PTS system glucose-specific IIA component
MFFRKKEKKMILYSPLNAEVIPLEQVPDPVFLQKMMGEGVGFLPINGEVVSPINGMVTQVFPTKHAIGMLTDEGLEVLLHLGLETVELKGEGFSIQVKEGDKVRATDPLGTFDLSFIKERGKETISVLVFPNLKEELPLKFGQVEAGAEIAQINIK